MLLKWCRSTRWFHVAYAGFFDPGFGDVSGGGEGWHGVESRSHEVPFILEDGQIIGRWSMNPSVNHLKPCTARAFSSNYQNRV